MLPSSSAPASGLPDLQSAADTISRLMQYAVSVFEAADAAVDVLLTDVVMPQMGGSELAERLLAASPTCA